MRRPRRRTPKFTAVPETGFLGLYSSYKLTRRPTQQLGGSKSNGKQRKAVWEKNSSQVQPRRKISSFKEHLSNMLCFWSLWHVACVIKSIPFFKLTMNHVAPKYLLIEMSLMMFCLNFWYLHRGRRVGVSIVGLLNTNQSDAKVFSLPLWRSR